MIVLHDLGCNLPAYGVNSVVAPAFDRVAAEGVVLKAAFSTSCGCSPSRASIATGLYPHANGVMGLAHPPFGWSLNASSPHIASILAGAGYETALFGFQHVVDDESTLGFDHLFTAGSALQDHVTADIGRFLTGWARDRPLYFEVNLEEPHRPFDQGGARPERSKGVDVPGFLPSSAATEDDLAAFQGAIRRADRGVGTVMEILEDGGLLEGTILIIVADHGIAMPRAKGTLYDPGVEVACMYRWPQSIPRGASLDGLASHVDILPTVLDAVGAEAPMGLQGVSYWRSLVEPSPLETDAVFLEKTFHSYYDPMRAIRTKRYKLILNFETAFAVEVPGDVEQSPVFRLEPSRYHGAQHPGLELYDLDVDPWEQVNLAGDLAYQSIHEELFGRLVAWMRETDDPILHGPTPSPSFVKALDRISSSRY